MSKKVWFLPLAFLAVWLPLSNTFSSSDNADPFRSTSERLLENTPGRLDRILALHTFVRDEIVEIPSQYG